MLRHLHGFFFLILLVSCGQPEIKSSADSQPVSQDQFKATTVLPDSADLFLGEVRADVKTSYVNFPADTFISLKKFRKWLPDDEYMHKETDAKHNDSPRTAEENHNVTLLDIYIYGVKREDDNDFHVILGPSLHTGKGPHFFSAEISGLPDPSSPYYAKLSEVREKFKTYFGDDIRKETVFAASDKKPPIHLQSITGSLFFDNHHYSGTSSVQGYKSFSAWEIHPVTGIEF